MKGPKTVYTCTECDYQSPKWLGKCPSCGAWNSFTEETYAEKRTTPGASAVTADKAEPFRDMAIPEYMRSTTGIDEFDRVLGGGLVVGSAILVAGEPGIGKSTLLMQLCGKMGDDHTIMYVSGEESRAQLKMRAGRLGVDPEKLLAEFTDEYHRGEFTLKAAYAGKTVEIAVPGASLGGMIKILQIFLEEYIGHNGGTLDYVHDDEAAERMSAESGNITFFMPKMRKEDLFATVISDGIFPKKSFSIGHARDKRYYLECRKIVK